MDERDVTAQPQRRGRAPAARRRLPAVRDAGRDARGHAALRPIIVGAYSDRSGGVCPMLAAHRCGGRTDFRSFARAWDRFTGAGKRARSATERELRTLTAQLEASIWARGRAARRGDALGAATPEPPADAPGPPQAPAAPGCGPFRRWDGYRDAVEAALRQRRAPSRAERARAASASRRSAWRR